MCPLHRMCGWRPTRGWWSPLPLISYVTDFRHFPWTATPGTSLQRVLSDTHMKSVHGSLSKLGASWTFPVLPLCTGTRNADPKHRERKENLLTPQTNNKKDLTCAPIRLGVHVPICQLYSCWENIRASTCHQDLRMLPDCNKIQYFIYHLLSHWLPNWESWCQITWKTNLKVTCLWKGLLTLGFQSTVPSLRKLPWLLTQCSEFSFLTGPKPESPSG